MCSLARCLFPTNLGKQCPTKSPGKALELTGAVTVGGRAGSCCICPLSPGSLEILGSLREPAQRCRCPAHSHCCTLPLEASKGSPAPAYHHPQAGEGAGHPSQSPGPSKQEQKSSSPTRAHLRCDFSSRQAVAVPSPRVTGVDVLYPQLWAQDPPPRPCLGVPQQLRAFSTQRCPPVPPLPRVLVSCRCSHHP